MAKYIGVLGAVFSGAGKGICAASIGLLLKMRGHNVAMIKFDPYLNTNAGTLRPGEHGESFVCDDGSETDLDLGSYYRISSIDVSSENICTAGTLHKELIDEQEQGKYLGQTIQLQPHLTDKIQQRLLSIGKDKDVVIIEIGGSIGDSESYVFLEALRQFKCRDGGKYRDDVLISVVAPILWVNTIKEFKTKPLQNGIKELQRHGLQPDVIFCRVDREVPEKILDKVSQTTGVKRECVFDAPDVSSIYQVPIELYNRHVDDMVVDMFRLGRGQCRINKYREVVEKYMDNSLMTVNIGVFCKYDNNDAYISLKEAIMHAGAAHDVKAEIQWIKADELEKYKDHRGLYKYFESLHGVIVPGGFDVRGVEGKIKAIEYAREKKIPFLGICLGLQCGVIEFARNVLELEEANSLEFNPNSPHPVIHFVKGQEGLVKKSATMRLGSYDCELVKDSLAYELYGSKTVKERHRHRYEVNQAYAEKLAEKGLKATGINPETGLIEIMELDRSIHPFWIGTQAHPEFKSRLTSASPLFKGLIEAAKKKATAT